MKIEFKTEEFRKILSVLAAIIAKKGLYQENGCITFSASGGEVTLASRNNNDASLVYFNTTSDTREGSPVRIIEEGQALLDAQQLKSLVAEMQSETLIIATNPGRNNILVDWGAGKAYLPSFESVPGDVVAFDESQMESAQLPCCDLAKFLFGTKYTLTADELHPVFNSVCLDIDKDSFTVATTDGHRIALRSAKTESEFTGRILFPGAFMPTILSILSSDKKWDTITIDKSGQKVRIHAGQWCLTLAGVVGKFPQYDTVIPKDNPFVLKANKKELLGAVKIVSALASKTSGVIRLKVEGALMDAKITLCSDDVGFGLKTNQTVNAEYTGEDITVGFKGDFVEDVVASCETEMITLHFKDSKSAVLVTDDDDHKIAVIMPVRFS